MKKTQTNEQVAAKQLSDAELAAVAAAGAKSASSSSGGASAGGFRLSRRRR